MIYQKSRKMAGGGVGKIVFEDTKVVRNFATFVFLAILAALIYFGLFQNHSFS